MLNTSIVEVLVQRAGERQCCADEDALHLSAQVRRLDSWVAAQILADIDIDLDGPAGKNIAVKGKTNTITVWVHNLGTKAADAVDLKVRWLPFTTAAT